MTPTAIFLATRAPAIDPYETATVAESLAKLAKRVVQGKPWQPLDLSAYGLQTYEYNTGYGAKLALAAMDGAEPVAWSRLLPGVWVV